MSLDRQDYKTAIPQLEKRLSAVESEASNGLASFDVLKSALEAERLARQKAILKVDEGIDLVTVKMFYALVDPDDYVGGLPPASTEWSETMPTIDETSAGLVLWYKSKTLRNGVVVNESPPQTIQIMDGVFSFINNVSPTDPNTHLPDWTTIDGGTISTGIITASGGGESYFNLVNGSFKIWSNQTQQGLEWDGTDLTIKGSITLTGHSDSVADEISALQISADGTLIYDHDYEWTGSTKVTFYAHVYRGGEDVTSEFDGECFTWYYKTEANLTEQPILNNSKNGTPTNEGKTIEIPATGTSPTVSLASMGYGGEIVGKFTPPSNSRNLLRSNGDTYTDVNNRSLQTRAGSGDEVRVRDLQYTTSLSTSNALMVVTSETEKLATIETLADTLKSSTTPIVDGTATAGTEKKFASGDHVHPTDTSRASAVHTHTKSQITDFPSLATVATSGDYTDLDNLPTIPTDTSDLTNGAGFISTETDPVFTASDAYGITSSDISNWNGKSDFSGDYDDLTNKPTIPTDTSDLTNGAGYITGITVVQTLATGVEIGSVEGTKLYAPQGGGGGTSDYSALSNKPSINSVTLSGNKTSSDLSLASASHTHTTSDVTDFPTLATVATSGDYTDLDNLPTIPTDTGDLTNGAGFITTETDPVFVASVAHGITSTDISNWNSAEANVQSDWSQSDNSKDDFIKNKPTIPDVSGKIDTAGTGLSKSGTTLNHSNAITAQTTQGLYPIKIDAQGHITAYGSAQTIPTVNNATLTIQKNGTTVDTFTANASSNVTANITVPTSASDVNALPIGGGTMTGDGQIINGHITNSSSREASANLTVTGKRGITALLSSGTMTTGRPPSADGTGTGEGTIIHCEWDNTGGWNSQLFIADNDSGNGKPFVAVRGQRSGTWTSWDRLLAQSDVVDYVIAQSQSTTSYGDGYWRWREWKSGKVEIWYHGSLALTTSESDSNGVKRYSRWFNFPNSYSLYRCTCIVNCMDQGGWYGCGGVRDSSNTVNAEPTRSFQVMGYRIQAQPPTTPTNLNIYICGQKTI